MGRGKGGDAVSNTWREVLGRGVANRSYGPRERTAAPAQATSGWERVENQTWTPPLTNFLLVPVIG